MADSAGICSVVQVYVNFFKKKRHQFGGEVYYNYIYLYSFYFANSIFSKLIK